MKKNASNAYSTNALVQMESWIDGVTERLLNKLHRQAGEPIDMSSVTKDYAMDAIFAVTFGRDFDFIEKGDVLKMYGILETVTDYMAIVSPVFFAPVFFAPVYPKSYESDLTWNSLGKSPGFIDSS